MRIVRRASRASLAFGFVANCVLMACMPCASAQSVLPGTHHPWNLEESISASTHIFVGTIKDVSYVIEGKEGNDVLSKVPPAGFPLGVIMEFTVLEALYQTGRPLPGSIYMALRGRADARLLERQREAGGSLIYFVRSELETVVEDGRPEERIRYFLARIGGLTVMPANPAQKASITVAVAGIQQPTK